MPVYCFGQTLDIRSRFCHGRPAGCVEFHNGPTYRCLFPTPPEPGAVPDCGDQRHSGHYPRHHRHAGWLQAPEDPGTTSGDAGTLLHWQATEQRFSSGPSRQDAEYKSMCWQPWMHCVRQTYPAFCGIRMRPQFPPMIWSYKTGPIFLDVRNTDELPEPWFDHLRWSLDEIRSGINQPELQGDVLVYCQTGSRTPEAIRLLKQRYPIYILFLCREASKAWQLAEMNKRYGRT